MKTATVPISAEERAGALAERFFNAAIATMDLATLWLGERLGYYRALAEMGEATPAALADRTGTVERYTREWLEQQAVTGIIDVLDTGDPLTRRYSLPAGHDIALTDTDSLAYVAAFGRAFLGMNGLIPTLANAYRTGSGVPYEDYGADVREGVAEVNRVLFINLLTQEWIPAMPDIDARLRDASIPARVADIGMGLGWSSISLAKGYPLVRVDGFDLDTASVASARANAEQAGMGDRVRFHSSNAANVRRARQYDFAMAFECIHDMSDPVATLVAMREMVGPGGTVLIGDEKVADQFTAPGDEVERLVYGASVLHCLPVSMVDQPSAATGTAMRADTLRQYAARAGFRSVEVLPIENDVWRFYRLTA